MPSGPGGSEQGADLNRLRAVAEFGIGLHAEFGLVETHFLVFVADPDTDGVFQGQPKGRAGHHGEGADGQDSDDLDAQVPGAEDADREAYNGCLAGVATRI